MRSSHRRRCNWSGKTVEGYSAEILEDRTLLSAGELDATFGDAGVVVTNVGETRVGFDTSDMAVQADGKVVMIGTVMPRGNVDTNHDIIVGRANVDDASTPHYELDVTFGDGGLVRLNAGPNYDGAGAVTILPTGQILVSGSSQYRFDENQRAVTSVWRLKSNGDPDRAFGGGDGVVHFADGPLYVTDIVVQSTGRIVVAGTHNGYYGEDFELIGLTPDGRVDTSFGNNGHTVTDIGTIDNGVPVTTRDLPSRAVVLEDDRILVMGTALQRNSKGAVARYSSNGQLDPTFSDDGRIRFDAWGSAAFDVHVLSDGNYLFGGAESARPAFLKMTVDGELDLSFGTNGFQKYIPPSGQSVRYGAIHRFDVQPDGTTQAFVSSTLGNGSSDPFQYASRLRARAWDYGRPAFFQVDSDFQLDTTVNSNGWSSIYQGIPGGSPAVEWLDDGRILIAGADGDLYRHLSSLLPDSSLEWQGSRVVVNVTLPSRDEAYAVTVPDDGSIFVGGGTRGVTGLGNPYGGYDAAPGGALALKFRASGVLDRSYDGYPPDANYSSE